MSGDPWLDKWIPELRKAPTAGPVLELGCGTGRDTQTLLNHGVDVIGSDCSSSQLHACRQLLPDAKLLRMDLEYPFPLQSEVFTSILASLCLHYFNWQVTQKMVAEIGRCLGPHGKLIARVNSDKDIHFGAGSGIRIEPNYYETAFGAKRFFDRKALEELFSGWNISFIEEATIDRFDHPKWVWEIAASPAKKSHN